jgi:hypothetical protein
MYDIPFDRSFLQLSNGIRHVVPYTDTKPELTAKASMAQPVSQPAVYANWLRTSVNYTYHQPHISILFSPCTHMFLIILNGKSSK